MSEDKYFAEFRSMILGMAGNSKPKFSKIGAEMKEFITKNMDSLSLQERDYPTSDSTLRNKFNKRQGQFPINKDLEFIKKFMLSKSMQWDEQKQQWISMIPKKGIFKNPELIGTYAMYHRAYDATYIYRNILKIEPDGKVTIKAFSNRIHTGKVEIFKANFMAINITEIHTEDGDDPFFYTIATNLDSYVEVGEIRHFFAVSTSISLNSRVYASLRFLKKSDEDIDFKSFDISDASEKEALTQEINIDSIFELLMDRGQIQCPWSVNEVPKKD